MTAEDAISDTLADVVQRTVRTFQGGLLVTDGRSILWADPSAAEILGIDRDDLQGMSTSEMVERTGPHDPERLSGIIRRRRTGGEAPQDYVFRRSEDGSTRYVEVLTSQPGADDRYVVILRDVTERESARREREELLEAIRILPDVVFRCEKRDEGRIYWTFNEGELAEELGLTTEAIEDVPLEEVFPGETSQEMIDHFETAFAGEPHEFAREIDGRYFRHHSQPVLDDEGDVEEVVGFITEITDLEKAGEEIRRHQEELQQTNEELREIHDALRFRTAVLEAADEAAVEGIVVIGDDGRLLHHNERVMEMWDVPPEVRREGGREIIRHAVEKLRDPEADRERVQGYLDDHDATGTDRLELEDGRVIERYTAPVVGEEGTYYGRLWTFRDVTDRQEFEERLRQERAVVELLQSIATRANQAEDVEEALAFALERICRHTGWPLGHVYLPSDGGDRLVSSGIFYVEDPDRFEDFRRATERTEIPRGSPLPGRVLETGDPHWIPDVTEVSTFLRSRGSADIGVRAAFAFPVLVGDEPVGVLEFFSDSSEAPDGDLLEVMAHIGTQLGRVIERHRARRTLREREQRFRRIFENTTVGFYRTTPDGEIVYANPALAEMLRYDDVEELVETNLLEGGLADPEDREDWREAIEEQGEFSGREAVWKRRDGSTIHVRESARVVRDDDGDVICYEGTVEDMTEIHRTRRALEESNEELEQFAYVVSHDLKTPLQGIQRLVDWIADDLGDDLSKEGRRHLGMLQERSERMAEMISGVLELSRVGRTEGLAETVDAAEIVDEVRRELDPPDGFEIRIDGDLPRVPAPRVRLRQILANLVDNAIEHHDDETGTVTVSARRLDDGLVEFAVADDGPGIPERFEDRVFDLFETLTPKESSAGTGVGLALVKKIVESHGGEVSLETAEGEGTTVRFTWPATPDAGGAR